MLKSTYKFLNALIPTISNPTGARLRVRTLLLPVGGWKAHPLFRLCMFSHWSRGCSVFARTHAAPCHLPVRVLARRKTYAARAVGPSAAAPDAVSPALCVGRGRWCLRPRRGRDGSGETPGSIWGRGPTSHPTATSFLPSFVLVLKLALFSKASR